VDSVAGDVSTGPARCCGGWSATFRIADEFGRRGRSSLPYGSTDGKEADG
jgi:hypothetical protein